MSERGATTSSAIVPLFFRALFDFQFQISVFMSQCFSVCYCFFLTITYCGEVKTRTRNPRSLGLRARTVSTFDIQHNSCSGCTVKPQNCGCRYVHCVLRRSLLLSVPTQLTHSSQSVCPRGRSTHSTLSFCSLTVSQSVTFLRTFPLSLLLAFGHFEFFEFLSF